MVGESGVREHERQLDVNQMFAPMCAVQIALRFSFVGIREGRGFCAASIM